MRHSNSKASTLRRRPRFDSKTLKFQVGRRGREGVRDETQWDHRMSLRQAPRKPTLADRSGGTAIHGIRNWARLFPVLSCRFGPTSSAPVSIRCHATR